MSVVIREYRPEDRPELIRLMEELQDHLVPLDSHFKVIQRLPEYGEAYVEGLMKRIQKGNGKILFAEDEGRIVGMIAGVIEETSALPSEQKPMKPARVLELVVSSHARGSGIGATLMKAMEDHFQSQGRDYMRVEVFAPNTSAHQFYKKMGYSDWVMDLWKKL